MERNVNNVKNNRTKAPLFGTATRGKGAGIAFSLSSMLATILLFVVILAIAVFGGTNKGFENTQWYLYLCYILPSVASIIIAYYYLKYTKKPIKSAVVEQKCHYKYFILAVVMQIGLLSLSEVNGWFIALLQKWGLSAGEVVLPSMDGAGFVGVFFVVAILAPLAEEILFRGAILDGLKSGFSTISAALVCGALFSLYHQNPMQTVYQFCCGFVYGLLAARAGSVLPTLLAHFLNNAYILILNKCGVTAIPHGVYLPMMIVSGICLLAVLSYLLFWDNKQEKTQEISLEKGEKNLEKKRFFGFASVGILICAITWISGLFA